MFGFLLYTAFAASQAYASCAGEDAQVVPAHGSVDVPLNVIPVIFYDLVNRRPETLNDIILWNEEGGEVPFSVDVISSGGRSDYVQLTPVGELKPYSRYTLTDGLVEVSFVTGSQLSESVPETTAVGVGHTLDEEYLDCRDGEIVDHDWNYASVSLELESVEGAGWYEARVTLDKDETEWTVLSPDSNFYLAESSCNSNLPALMEADRVHVEVRAVNLAGEPGPWSEAIHVEIPWPEMDCDSGLFSGRGCASESSGDGEPGCVTGRTGRSTDTVWLLGVLMLWRRQP